MRKTHFYDVDIVATGSSGNMIVIDDVIVIDFGVKYSTFIENAPNVEHIFVSHQHTDHINYNTVSRLYRHYPALVRNGLHLNTGTADLVNERKPLDGLVLQPSLGSHSEFDIETSRGVYHIETFPLVHDVENQGFMLTNEDGYTLVHATDTATMRYCPDRKFDVLLVEGNWDEEILVDSLTADIDSVMRATRNLRHLSSQSCLSFMKAHKYDDSLCMQLHESGAFGSTLVLENI